MSMYKSSQIFFWRLWKFATTKGELISECIYDVLNYVASNAHCVLLEHYYSMAKMTSIKGSFLALGACSQSWKLNNLWKNFLVKLTGVTSCLLQFDRNFFCSNNFSNVKCKVSNLKWQCRLIFESKFWKKFYSNNFSNIKFQS